MRRRLKQLTSLFLVLVMVFTMLPTAVLAEGIDESLVTRLAAVYDGDEERAQEELEALYDAGIIDENGNMVSLDIREDGESADLTELAQRIADGEDVGAITVNGNNATPEQIVQISQVNAMLELLKALDEDVEITDEHVANLEALLEGIADGSVDLDSALEIGMLSMNTRGSATRGGMLSMSTQETAGVVEVNGDGKYVQPMIDGATYEAEHDFELLDPTYKNYYVGTYGGVVADGVVSLSADKNEYNPGETVTVTASLNKAQAFPVSFDWSIAGDGVGVAESGTVTWGANDTELTKTFTATIPAKESGELWQGSRGLQISAGNIQNALFSDGAEGTATAWNKTVSVKASDANAITATYPPVSKTYQASAFQTAMKNDLKLGDMYYNVRIYYKKIKNEFSLSSNFSDTIYTGTNTNGGYFSYDLFLVEPTMTSFTTDYIVPRNKWYLGFDTAAANANYKYLSYDNSGYKMNPYPSSGTASGNVTGLNVGDDNEMWMIVLIANTTSGGTTPSMTSINIQSRAPAVTNKVKQVTVPAGTYHSGQVVPITVEFEDFVGVNADTKLMVNQVACAPLDALNTETRKVTFGYTVKDVDTGFLAITALSGLKNSSGLEQSLSSAFTGQSFGANEGIHLESTGVKSSSIAWTNAKYGISDDDPGQQLITVTLPLGTKPDWVATEAVEYNSGSPITVDLPGYPGAVANWYLPSAYLSCDGGNTRYPVYVAESGSTAVLFGCISPFENETLDLRKDTVNLFLAPEILSATNQADVTKYLPAWNADIQFGDPIDVDSEKPDAAIVLGKNWTVYVRGGIAFENTEDAYVVRSDTYDAVESGFIKFGDSYVVAQDTTHPENQFDVEITANEEFFNAVKNGIHAEASSVLTLGYQISNRDDFTFTAPKYFTWSSSNDAVATVVKDEVTGAGQVVFTGNAGTVKFTLTVGNGSASKAYTLDTPEITALEGKDPFLNIPALSQIRTTLTGEDTDVLFASNLTARNYAVGMDTTAFTATLYNAQKTDSGYSKDGDPIGEKIESTSTVDNTLTHITVPGGKIADPGIYAVVISAKYEGGTVDGVDTEAQEFSATAYLEVKQAPVKVTLNELESYSVTSDQIPEIGYSVLNSSTARVEYTIQKSGEPVSERKDPLGKTLPFDPVTPNGLKDVYTITVYAKNDDDEAWSVDSMLLTVYNKDALDIIVADVTAGEIGGTTGGAGTVADDTTVAMDNSGKLEGYGVTDEVYQLTFDDFNALRTDMSLQKIISANYGSGIWGLLSDKMQWESSNPDLVSVDYKQGGIYSDIQNYSYTSYVPTTDFLLAGKGATGDSKVTITATHAATNTKASFDVTTATLDNQLFMFQFQPKVTTTVIYTNGKGVERTLTTNNKGQLAVYEPDGFQEDGVLMAKSEKAGITYVGTFPNIYLVSGERDIGALQLYPCNNYKLRPVADANLTFIGTGGNPYNGSVIIRAGVYKNGVYCPDAKVRLVNDTTVNKSGRLDYSATVTKGKLKVGFDVQQFNTPGETNGLQPGEKVSYVIEYRSPTGSFRPGYIRLDVAGNPKGEIDAKDSMIQLDPVGGDKDQPQISKQIMQQYYDGTTPTAYTRDVINYTENIGVSPRFDKTELTTTMSLPGETVTTDGNGYSVYTSTTDFGFTLNVASSGKVLTGQTGGKVAKNTVAAQIVNLDDLNDATLFVFPFSAVPMVHGVYTMTDANLRRDGISDQGDTPSVRVKAQFTKGNLTIRSDTLPFGVSNVTHQKDLSESGGGAAEIAGEVKVDLAKQMDIGGVFESVGVNEMLKKGFAFLSKLRGSGDQPLNMIILPTQDPAVFRIVILIGGMLHDEESTEGLIINYDSDKLAEDAHEFGEKLEELNKNKADDEPKKDKDDDDEGEGEGEIDFRFSGALYLTAKCDIVHNDWDISFTGGKVGTSIKASYTWSQNFMCGPVPFFVEFEASAGAKIQISFVSKVDVRAMLLDTTLSVSLRAFAGLGFDLSLVAFKLGIEGKVGAAVDFQYLTQTGQKDMNGTELSIGGSIGIKMEVKFLIVSYSKTFASTGFGWSKTYGQYNEIQDAWGKNGLSLQGVTESGRMYTMQLMSDDTALITIEGGGEIENRDYLDIYERAWGEGLMLMDVREELTTLTNMQSNAYPYSNPVFTDDGSMFLYISDNDNADELQSVVSYAVKNENGYENKDALYDTKAENAILADSDVVASGTGNNVFAAWVKQMESPEKEMHDKVTYDDLGMMMNATEIYTASYDGSQWTTERLTDNNMADMAPTIASSGNNAIVAWRSLAATELPEDGAAQDITASFNAENNINYCYRVYDDTNGWCWSEAQIAYNGSAGTVNAIDSAMLSDGTAILVYTVRTDDDDATSTETFYTVINKDGAIVTTGRLTNDDCTDTNAQVAAVNSNGGQFVVGWYTEYENGETTHDVRFASINANSSVDKAFPESIGSADINTYFTFSAPANCDSLNDLSIVWPEEGDEGGALKAVRFYETDGAIGVTTQTTIAEFDKFFTVDQLDAYTDGDGAVHALVLGSDYSEIKGIDTYDTIDLTNLPVVEDTPEDNSEQQLEILTQTPNTRMMLGSGGFESYAIKADANYDITEVTPGLELPVQFTVTNTGTSALTGVSVKIGEEKLAENSELVLLPNESTTLTAFYEVPEDGSVNDVEYAVTSSGTTANGTLVLNRPDVGIAEMKLIREGDGTRDIQVRLSNDSNIPLSGSGKTVKLAFYKDSLLTESLGEPISIEDANSFGLIDEGVYTYVKTLNVRDLIAEDAVEIPDDGVTVYAKAWIVDANGETAEEYYSTNNTSSIWFKGLLTKYEAMTTMDMAVQADNTEGNYNINADIRNNSLQKTDLGTITVDVLDSNNKVLTSITMNNGGPLTLNTEQTRRLSKTISVDNGTPASVSLRSSTMSVVLDAATNGGACPETSITLTKDSKVSGALPEASKTGSRFNGWFTEPSGGEKITAETVFGKNGEGETDKVEPNEEGVYVIYAQFTRNAGASNTITCEEALNGSIKSDVDKSTSGKTITLTVTPDKNFAVHNVTVLDKNGKEVPVTKNADGTYGFTMVEGGVTVSATFVDSGKPTPPAKEYDDSYSDCPQDTTCPMYKFTDLDPKAWYHDGIHFCLDSKIMNGVGDNKFDPNGTTNRAMIVTMLWRMEGEPASNYAMTFKDVENGTWYTEAVRWAAENGIVNGYSKDAFGPNDNTIREQIVTILHRYASYKGIDTSEGEKKPLAGFDDTRDVPDWAVKAFRWAVDAGIINGADNNKISPKLDASRDQVATMLMRFCQEAAK